MKARTSLSLAAALAAGTFIASWTLAAEPLPQGYPVCRIVLSVARKAKPAGQAQKPPREDKTKLDKAAGLFGGIDFQSESDDAGGADYRSAEVQNCSPDRAKALHSDVMSAFTPEDGQAPEIEFGFQVLERPGVRQGTIASRYLADMTALALKKLGAAGPDENLDAVPVGELQARIGNIVRSQCGEPAAAQCDDLKDALIDPFGGTLTGSSLFARLNRPYEVPSPKLPVIDPAGPKAPEEQPWATRLRNNIASTFRHGTDVTSGYNTGGNPYGSIPAYAGTDFKDFDAPFKRPIHILSPYGAPRSGGRSHQGVDISCTKIGEPIFAPARGFVEGHRFGNAGISGNRLWLDHGNSTGGHLETFYAHLADFAVRPGQEVQKGDLIGYCGMTGNAAGLPLSAVHLHYECHVSGPSVNPDPACFPNAQKK